MKKDFTKVVPTEVSAILIHHQPGILDKLAIDNLSLHWNTMTVEELFGAEVVLMKYRCGELQQVDAVLILKAILTTVT